MYPPKWRLPLFLLCAPVVTAFAQISVLDFPTTNPLFGNLMSYSPWPQVIYFPLGTGVALAIIGKIITSVLTSKYNISWSGVKKLSILSVSSIFMVITFWLGIYFSQQSIIFEYLVAINANGLHFLRLSKVPIIPEVFPHNVYQAFYIIVIVNLIGAVIIFSFHFFVFHRNRLHSVERGRISYNK